MDQVVDERPDDQVAADSEDDLVERLAWEEELEKRYGDSDEALEEKRHRAMGPGFSKQKQIIEENQRYRGDVKKKIDVKDNTTI